MPRRQTYSESLFESFCSQNQIPCHPVPTSGRRTPDYKIEFGDLDVFCEVKQIDMNRREREQLEILRQGNSIADYLPNRLRRKLRLGSPQVQDASNSGNPTMLVVYNNVPILDHTAHEQVMEAMFGQITFSISWPEGRTNQMTVSDPSFGGRRTITPWHNTSISVIGILEAHDDNRVKIRAYHNPFARVPLNPQILTAVMRIQYTLIGGNYSEFTI